LPSLKYLIKDICACPDQEPCLILSSLHPQTLGFLSRSAPLFDLPSSQPLFRDKVQASQDSTPTHTLPLASFQQAIIYFQTPKTYPTLKQNQPAKMASASALQSSGRGGAGNFNDSSKTPKLQPEDLQTPTLKTAVVTTGRGGTGNMAKNSDPLETRLRQDVEP